MTCLKGREVLPLDGLILQTDTFTLTDFFYLFFFYFLTSETEMFSQLIDESEN